MNDKEKRKRGLREKIERKREKKREDEKKENNAVELLPGGGGTHVGAFMSVSFDSRLASQFH